MYISIQHNTRFRYSNLIMQSVMEVRMQPRTEGIQRCLHFKLITTPRARIAEYRDHLGNAVHTFDVPGAHKQLTITAETLVEMYTPSPLPNTLPESMWESIDYLGERVEYWDMLHAGERTAVTSLLMQFRDEIGAYRQRDPLSLLRDLNTRIYRAFDYDPSSTTVDSTIDEALETRHGVCQDYAHIMAALVRTLGIPCRYVSGYLYHQRNKKDRSNPDATHAWVEAYLPPLGWVGFDPTNNVIAAERHVRAAVGRDYADVPPTHGVFKGMAESDLEVEVRVNEVDPPTAAQEFAPVGGWVPLDEQFQLQQAQQQQQ
jgi:transglutaminase-like putative cysteine protease